MYFEAPEAPNGRSLYGRLSLRGLLCESRLETRVRRFPLAGVSINNLVLGNFEFQRQVQVAVQHLLAILQDLKACSGRQRFQSIGLDFELLRELETQTLRFASLTERLLLDCSKARSFARTLFQLLLFQAQKLTENTDATPSTRPESRSGATKTSKASWQPCAAAAHWSSRRCPSELESQ